MARRSRKVLVQQQPGQSWFLRPTSGAATAIEKNRVVRTNIEWVSINALKPAPRNPRTHSKKQISRIADSIDAFGFNNPIIVDQRGRIIAGHGRFEAAKLLQWKEVPIVRLSHLSEEHIRAYVIADNKLADMAGWDRELLRVELSELEILLPHINLDLNITGFESQEIDALFVDLDSPGSNPADDIPDVKLMPVARPGDIFNLGPHRISVADARERTSYTKLMRAERAIMTFADPPYNVKITGHVGGRGRIKHREFMCASGELSDAEFTGFLRQSLALCTEFSVDGAIHFICMDWRHAGDLLAAAREVYTEQKNLCVWNKSNAGQGSFYRSQHELVFVFKHGTAPHLNTFELGQNGRMRSNVWSYAGVNSFRAGRLDELKMHPTVKPVALVADAMRDCSRRGDIVLDPFAGAGTTIVAAQQTGRRAFCIEIDPRYVDVSIRRWQAYARQDATLESTNETFDELTVSRSPPNKDASCLSKRQRSVPQPPSHAGPVPEPPSRVHGSSKRRAGRGAKHTPVASTTNSRKAP